MLLLDKTPWHYETSASSTGCSQDSSVGFMLGSLDKDEKLCSKVYHFILIWMQSG